MCEDLDNFFNDDFVKRNLSFLLEEDFEDSGNSSTMHYELSLFENNQSITYQSSRFSTEVSTTWSSSSSGSLSSSKEELSQFINIPLPSDKCLPKVTDDNKRCVPQQDDGSFATGLAEYCTSTPKKKSNHGKTRPENTDDSNNINELLEDKFCGFCWKNGEPSRIITSHNVKLPNGKVECPILKKYVCELCGATGEKAHTRKYCNLYSEEESSRHSSRRLANGRRVTFFNHK